MWFIDRERETYYQLDPESAETTAAFSGETRVTSTGCPSLASAPAISTICSAVFCSP